MKIKGNYLIFENSGEYFLSKKNIKRKIMKESVKDNKILDIVYNIVNKYINNLKRIGGYVSHLIYIDNKLTPYNIYSYIEKRKSVNAKNYISVYKNDVVSFGKLIKTYSDGDKLYDYYISVYPDIIFFIEYKNINNSQNKKIHQQLLELYQDLMRVVVAYQNEITPNEDEQEMKRNKNKIMFYIGVIKNKLSDEIIRKINVFREIYTIVRQNKWERYYEKDNVNEIILKYQSINNVYKVIIKDFSKQYIQILIYDGIVGKDIPLYNLKYYYTNENVEIYKKGIKLV